MKRTTIWLPDDLSARLAAQASRTGVKTAELIRRAVDAFTPPIGVSMGELRRRVDRTGLLKVIVLDARAGRLLVEPGGGFDGMFEPSVQMWVPADLVTFPQSASEFAIPDVKGDQRPWRSWEGLRLNKTAATKEPKEPAPGHKPEDPKS
jgi:hypothetical protein